MAISGNAGAATVPVRKLLDGLDREQAAAAGWFTSPVMILAGAGSGKTRTLCARMARLLLPEAEGGMGADPSSLVMVTFTNRAAREMRERLEPVLATLPAANRPLIGTFHALSLELIRRWPRLSGLPDRWVVVDRSQERQYLLQALSDARRGDSDPDPGEVERLQERIESVRSRRGGAEAAEAALRRRPVRGTVRTEADIWIEARRAMHADHGITYADMLDGALACLASPGCREGIAGRIRHIMVDEAQDMSEAQLEWLLRLDRAAGSPCTVLAGDDDQAIYGFRGGNLAAMRQFGEHWPDGRIMEIGTNYRSAPEIVGAGRRLMDHAAERYTKDLRSAPAAAASPEPPSFRWTGSGMVSHAAAIARMVKEALAAGEAPGEIAVLCRTRIEVQAVERALEDAGLDHHTAGGTGFRDRQEIRDMLAWLTWLQCPGAAGAMRRVANRPARGLPPTAMNALLRTARAAGTDAETAVRQIVSGALPRPDGMTSRASEAALRLLVTLVDPWRRAMSALPAAAMLRRIYKESGWQEQLAERAAGESDAARRAARRQRSLETLFARAEAHDRAAEELGELPDSPVVGFHEQLMLESEISDQPDAQVTVSTIHGAKGCEWNRVILGFMLDDERLHFPPLAGTDEKRLDPEERRVTYVAITRARQRLSFVAPPAPMPGPGQQAPGPVRPLPFVAEAGIPVPEIPRPAHDPMVSTRPPGKSVLEVLRGPGR